MGYDDDSWAIHGHSRALVGALNHLLASVMVHEHIWMVVQGVPMGSRALACEDPGALMNDWVLTSQTKECKDSALGIQTASQVRLITRVE